MANEYNTGGLFGSGTNAYQDGDHPVWTSAIGRYRAGRLRSTILTGGVAGTHTITGIRTTDKIVTVTRYVGAGVAVTDIADLTSEFTITANDTISNAGGTNTTGDKLQVWWTDRTP
jgi:hypothetical protein